MSAAVDLPIKVPTTHRRRQFIYYLDGSPVIEPGKWAVASFDIKALGRLVGYAVARYTYVEGVGYDLPDWHFPETKEEALALVLELTCDAPAEDL